MLPWYEELGLLLGAFIFLIPVAGLGTAVGKTQAQIVGDWIMFCALVLATWMFQVAREVFQK